MVETEINANPRIVHRECGGFLALSDGQTSLKIGVTAPTEEEAVSLFRVAIAAGRALLASPGAGEVSSATGSVAASSA